jgi:DNA polymerase-4
LTRVVLHLDMDAFYAAIEVREDPTLAGLPLIVGRRGGRGVVATCSYEARRFGVRSAMPSVRAERLCPQATWRAPRMDLYARVSREIRALIDEVSPVVEPLSIDEAFVDLTGIARDLAQGARVATGLKVAIRAAQSLTASVGVAPNKFLAKVASDLEKPDGLVVLGHDALAERLWPLPVERRWGVGPRPAERIRRGGVRTIGELLRVAERDLALLCGARAAAHLQALARGEDERPVEAEHRAKSISEERTYGEDLHDPQRIDRALLARSEGVARQLRREGLAGRTVQLKVRAGDFETWTRAVTLAEPTDLAEPIVAAARRLYRERIRLGGRGIRLLGVGIAGLQPAGSGQGALFEDETRSRVRKAALASDAVRARMGERSLTRARLIRPREPR